MSASLGQWWVRLARLGSGGGSLRLWPLLVGWVVLPVFLDFRGSGPGFSSAHFWSLLHWRRLSVGLPSALVACCLASLRAGVWQSSVAVADFRAGIDGRLSSSPSGEEVGSISYTLAYSGLDFGFV